MLVNFMVHVEIWKGNLNLTEKLFSIKEMWCVVDNHNYICHISAKGFFESNFKQLLKKYQLFTKLP